ncbi:DNA pilot protein [Microviridae sp.]|nr:DNA pilot protein [Microviridae sp.]
MPIIAGAIIAGGASLIGGERANQQSAKSAAKSINFQREMARNAHQYEVEDLKKAGLNPILSAMGSGARASGGAQYQARNTLDSAVQSALAVRKQNAEIDLLKASTVKTANEGKINEVEATIMQGLLDRFKPTISSGMDAMKEGGRKVIEGMRGVQQGKGLLNIYPQAEAPPAPKNKTTTTKKRSKPKSGKGKGGYYYKGQWYDFN